MIIEIWEIACENHTGYMSPLIKKSKSEPDLNGISEREHEAINYRKQEGMISYLHESISTMPCREGITEVLYRNDYEKVHIIPVFEVRNFLTAFIDIDVSY